jgi:hypothetical protein
MTVAATVSILEALLVVEDVVHQLQQINQSRNEGCMDITSGVQLREVVINDFVNTLELSIRKFVKEEKDVFYIWLFDKVQRTDEIIESSRKIMKLENEVVERQARNVKTGNNKQRAKGRRRNKKIRSLNKNGNLSDNKTNDALLPKHNTRPFNDMNSAGIAPGPDEEGYYFVEDILSRRYGDGQWEFLCSFKGYSETDNMWLPYSNLNPWCQKYALKLFGIDGNDRKLPIPTRKQQSAVNAALRESREKTYTRHMQILK